MALDNRITHVLVSLVDTPITGTAKLLVRLQEYDRDLITDASVAVGMSQQKFMQAVLVSAAKKVLKEMGVQSNE